MIRDRNSLFQFTYDSLESTYIKTLCSTGFYFRDKSAWLDPRKLFLDITFHAENSADSSALKRTDFVTGLNLPGHSLIDSISVVVGKGFFVDFS